MPLKLMTPSASTPRTCPLSIRTTGDLAGVDCADAAPSIAAAASRTAEKYLEILCARGFGASRAFMGASIVECREQFQRVSLCFAMIDEKLGFIRCHHLPDPSHGGY